VSADAGVQGCARGREGLSAYPTGLVVCGGETSGERVGDALRLDLATMRWEPMPALVTARGDHTCCAVRGTLVVLGGATSGGGLTSSVETLSSEEGGAFVDLPPLSYGVIHGAAAVVVDKSDSAAGQVLILGGEDYSGFLSSVHLVDLATGACAQQLTSSTGATFQRRGGCRMGASSARGASVVIRRRRRYGARRSRRRRMQHGAGERSPR
jgi:hypothetical protein